MYAALPSLDFKVASPPLVQYESVFVTPASCAIVFSRAIPFCATTGSVTSVDPESTMITTAGSESFNSSVKYV